MVNHNPASSQEHFVKLNDERFFEFENGIWTGKKAPLVECPVIRNTNFTDSGELDLTDVAFIAIEQRQLEKKRLEWGDIIIERSGGGPSQPVGRVAFFDLATQDNYCFSNFTSRLRVVDTNKVDPEYLFRYLFYLHASGQTEKLQRRTTGIRNLAFSDYQSQDIPLPSLPTQRAIARALRAVQQAAQARRREAELRREQKRALMALFFTKGLTHEETKQSEVGEIPAPWHIKRLGEVATIASGGTPDRSNPDYWNGQIPWVKTGEIRYNTISTTEEQITEAGLSNSAAKIFPAGTLLMAMYGQGITRGRVAILGIDAAINQACAAITLSLGMDRAYSFHYLTHIYERIRDLGHGANQKNLNSALVKSIPIPIPTLAEQNQIGQTLNHCDTAIRLVEHEADLLDELFHALLDALLTGQLAAGAMAEN